MLQELFEIEFPLIQAPMAGVQDSALAIAVSNIGGLGSLPCAMLNKEALLRELTVLQAQTSKPYNLNFFCHTPPQIQPQQEAAWCRVLAPYFEEFGLDTNALPKGPERQPFSTEVANSLEAFRPAVVSFHFGLPEKSLLARVKSWGSKVIASATTIEEALFLEAAGVDAIIAQGLEAGGHRGNFLSDNINRQKGIFTLLPQIVRAVQLPVIAAGGIVDAEGVAAAMALGAAGVQTGSAYLLCPESTTSTLHRAALKSEAAQFTALTNIFTGRVARGIVNRAIRELGPINHLAPDFPLASTAITALRSAAEKQGSADFSPLWCGQNGCGQNGCGKNGGMKKASSHQELGAAELTLSLASGF